MSTDGILRFQNTKKATFVGPTSNISFDTVNSSLGIGVTGDDVPSSNLYITGNAYVSSNLALGGVLTMGTVNVVARHSLQAVTEIGNTTSLTTEFTNPTTSLVASGNVEINGQTTISGHIIPSVNNAYDIGSAENKIRDLYVDNNSLWVGDRAKISFSRGRMMFKHRKLNHVPRVVLQLALNDGRQNEAAVEQEAIAFAQTVDPTVSSLEDVRLEHWRDFTKTIDETKEVSDIFADNEEDYEAMTAADAFKEVGSNIFTTHGVTIGGDTDPRAILDIADTGAVIVPVGTTAERPPTAVNGMFRYNSETGYFEMYSASGWGSIVTPPSITSFTPTAVETGTSSGTQITVTGSFFDQNSSIKLRGSDGTLYSTTGFSFTSTTSISATLPSLPIAKSPYTVVVTAGSGLSTESMDTLVSGNTPVWISPEEGATVSSSSTITLSVTDADGDTLTYSIVSGTLPSGLTLSGNQISGTSTAAGGSTSTITVRASDGDLYADRTFIIETPLYAFTSHTFTNAGATGRIGPTLTQCRNAYNVTWDGDTSLFNVVTQGIQELTVPETGTYEFEVVGAGGGYHSHLPSSTSSKPLGAKITARLDLNMGNKINILVGQRGEDIGTYVSSMTSTESDNAGAGGGGGSYVFVNASDTEPLLVAGGGGGGTRTSYGYSNGVYNSTTASNSASLSNGGSSGNGGTTNTGGSSYWAGAGAGWKTNGTGGNNATNYNYSGGSRGGEGGRRPYEGGFGGIRWNDGTDSGGNGGFGGGGAGGSDNMGAGGGGGYSGGGGGRSADAYHGSGGGSSYVTSSAYSVTRSLASTWNHGYVKITLI
jgi:hypothetical protein